MNRTNEIIFPSSWTNEMCWKWWEDRFDAIAWTQWNKWNTPQAYISIITTGNINKAKHDSIT